MDKWFALLRYTLCRVSTLSFIVISILKIITTKYVMLLVREVGVRRPVRSIFRTRQTNLVPKVQQNVCSLRQMYVFNCTIKILYIIMMYWVHNYFALLLYKVTEQNNNLNLGVVHLHSTVVYCIWWLWNWRALMCKVIWLVMHFVYYAILIAVVWIANSISSIILLFHRLKKKCNL